MRVIKKEAVISVHHWNDSLFSIRTTRNPSFRFENGQFTLVGIERDGRKVMRAYSMVSANYEDHLEFFSIKVPDGPLTSQLATIQPGDALWVSQKTTGTLVNGHLQPGKRLYMFATGTGLAPFLSLIKDPSIYDAYESVILAHCVRKVSDLAYQREISHVLTSNPYFGESVKEKLIYFPTVTREPFRNQGRLTDLLKTDQLTNTLGLPPLAPAADRIMLCGNPEMIKEMSEQLSERGFAEAKSGHLGHYVIERAFVER